MILATIWGFLYIFYLSPTKVGKLLFYWWKWANIFRKHTKLKEGLLGIILRPFHPKRKENASIYSSAFTLYVLLPWSLKSNKMSLHCFLYKLTSIEWYPINDVKLSLSVVWRMSILFWRSLFPDRLIRRSEQLQWSCELSVVRSILPIWWLLLQNRDLHGISLSVQRGLNRGGVKVQGSGPRAGWWCQFFFLVWQKSIYYHGSKFRGGCPIFLNKRFCKLVPGSKLMVFSPWKIISYVIWENFQQILMFLLSSIGIKIISFVLFTLTQGSSMFNCPLLGLKPFSSSFYLSLLPISQFSMGTALMHWTMT